MPAGRAGDGGPAGSLAERNNETAKSRQRRPPADRPPWSTGRHPQPAEGGLAARRQSTATPLRQVAETGDAAVTDKALAAEEVSFGATDVIGDARHCEQQNKPAHTACSHTGLFPI